MDNVQTVAGKFAPVQAEMQSEFFGKFFLLGGWIGATDTYKRTMYGAFPEYAVLPSAFHLTMRRGLPEEGAGDQLIMAGHECHLAQWFNQPLKRSKIELAADFYSNKTKVRWFPHQVWKQVLAAQQGDDIHLPLDVWGFPGGQTFVKGVPCMSFEGMGGLVSYLEPAMCRYFETVIQATKGRLMKLASEVDAEFGLRAAHDEIDHIRMLLARYVGSGGRGLTSNDTAVMLFPDLFTDIGTIGHELMCVNQSLDKKLSVAEFEMLCDILARIPDAKVLTDLVDPRTVGLKNFIEAMRLHPEALKAGSRADSGKIAELLALYHNTGKQEGIGVHPHVFEDEVKPPKIREVYQYFREHTGDEPSNLIPGSGGYWFTDCHRDTVSAAFKRSSTQGRPNVKFSGSKGKESIGGTIRVYGQGDTMIVADASEKINGEPLFVKLVDQGKIVYSETFQEQAARADRTWGQYKQFKLSPVVQAWMDQYRSMREQEIAEAQAQLAAAQPVPPPISGPAV
jgi:nicotinic acid phosphoribosyltransferase